MRLLPLPKWCYADKHLHAGSSAIRKEVYRYARANVAHATAAKDAEIAQLEKANEQLHAHGERMHAKLETLRAEAIRTEAKLHQQAELAEARAERLAEALRDAKGYINSFNYPGVISGIEALLREQEKTDAG